MNLEEWISIERTLNKVGDAGLVEWGEPVDGFHEADVDEGVGGAGVLRRDRALGVELLLHAAQVGVQVGVAEAAVPAAAAVATVRRSSKLGDDPVPRALPVLPVSLYLIEKTITYSIVRLG